MCHNEHFTQDRDNELYERRVLHTRNHPRGVSRFGCSWLLPVLVACTRCAFNLTKYSYHFGFFRLWEVFLAHIPLHTSNV